MRKRTLDGYFGDQAEAERTIAQTIDLTTKTIEDGLPGSVTPGAVVDDESVVYAVNLVAGVTYSFAQRPTADGGMQDPLLILYGPDQNFITYDDDGGAGLGSLLSYTPTVSGTYYLEAASWGAGDNGNFEFVRWDSTQPDAGDTRETATEIDVGLTTGSRLARSDVDMYKIDLDGGQYYTFAVSGGRDGAGETGITAQVELLDANGNVVASHYGNESGVGYLTPGDGTYYVRITPHPTAGATKGGYTLDVAAVDLASKDPLEALNWDSANNISAPDGIVYVYFAPAGQNYGQTEPANPALPMATYGWEQFQIDGVMNAIQTNYTPITGLTYVRTMDESQAQLKLVTTINQTFGARFYPQDPANGSLQGVGSFNLISGGFGTDPNSLLRGGFSYAVVLHEFGHAHGVAHPHDTGGGSEVMAGVFGSTGSFGAYNLNQGVYTVMSYNDGWPLDPDGTRTYSAATRGSGWSGSLSAFDIAVLQERYGVHDNATGNDTYLLSDTQAGAMYQCIWDSAGTDTIAYSGTKNVQIDLMAATLDYSATGGGAISFAHGVFGGYTIANGAEIENATGGSGNDLLLGNSLDNVLTGNGGNDNLAGRGGVDVYAGGAGADTILAFLDSPALDAKRGPLSYDITVDFDGTTDKIDLIDLDAKVGVAGDQAFKWVGTSAAKNAGDLGYKVYDSVNGAEKALGIEISDYSGAYKGKVTVVMANVDGGAADYAMVLLGAPTLDATDFSL